MARQVLLALFTFTVAWSAQCAKVEHDGEFATSAPATLVKVGFERERGAQGGPPSGPFVDAAGRGDIGNRFRGVGEVDSIPVTSGMALLSASNEEMVAIGVVQWAEKDGRHDISTVLKTKVPVRFLAPGWHVLDLKINGEDYVLGSRIEPGRYRMRLLAEPEE